MINWYTKNLFDDMFGNMIDKLGIQNVYTPVAEIEAATGFSFIGAVPENCSNICVLFNVEFVIYFLNSDYIKNNNVKIIFGYDSEIDKSVAFRTFADSKYNNYELIDLTKFSETKDIEELKKAMGQRKFDVVFSNPPYPGQNDDKALDLKIIDLINANKKIILQPAGWIYADKSSGKAKTWTNILGKYITYACFCDFNSLMNIKIKTLGGIIVYDYSEEFPSVKIDNIVTNEHYVAKDIYDVTKFGLAYSNLVKPFKEYIQNNYHDLMLNHFISKPISNYDFKFSIWCGHVGKDDFYSPINITGIQNHIVENYKDFNIKNFNFIHFNNEDERNNFCNTWKSKVYRFILALTKENIHFTGNTIALIPWLDFTQSWNDKKLCKEFNISKELWDYIDKFIPDYYDDYQSGFETCRIVFNKIYDKPSKEMIDFCGEEIINQIMNKEYDRYWHNKEANGAAVRFEKDNKKYVIQKSVNNGIKENSKYRDRVGYEIYESYR